jgi:hypothetical protein
MGDVAAWLEGSSSKDADRVLSAYPEGLLG